MATHSSILAWEIPWIEEPGGLQSIGSHRVGHDLVTKQTTKSLLKLMSIELVTPSNHLILCQPLLLLPSIFPSIRVFSSESSLCIRWPEYWSFNFSISPFILLKSESVSRSVVSDSLQPHGLEPARLLYPWDFPGKSTGGDCHSTQGSNPGLPHCRQTLSSEPQGSPLSFLWELQLHV